jgi:hypothetical protein
MDQLLALRSPGLEPGEGAARQHVDSCATCAAELARLDQRVARLKALPALRPAQDRWPAVQREFVRVRRTRIIRWLTAGAGIAAAAAALFVVAARRDAEREDRQLVVMSAGLSLDAVQARSQALEAALRAYDPEARMLDGRTGIVAQRLEDRIASVDQELSGLDAARQQARAVKLWNERVGLLGALVDVHVTRASNVGL